MSIINNAIFAIVWLIDEGCAVFVLFVCSMASSTMRLKSSSLFSMEKRNGKSSGKKSFSKIVKFLEL